jgi:YVTN family beta-propeller protein
VVRVWVTNEVSGTLTRIDPIHVRVTQTIKLGRAPTAVIFADGRIWVTIQDPRNATNQL